MAHRVSCDKCQTDLSGGGKMPGYRLTLNMEAIPTGPEVYMVYVVPPLDGEKHFCSLKCLKEWLDAFKGPALR